MVESKKLTILPYYRDADNLYVNIRKSTLEEINIVSKLSGITPLNIIKLAVNKSDDNVWSYFYENKLLGCCGVQKSEQYEGYGVIWDMSTKHAEKRKIAYFKAVSECLERAKRLYPKGLVASNFDKFKIMDKMLLKWNFKPISKIDLGGNNFIIYLLKKEDY